MALASPVVYVTRTSSVVGSDKEIAKLATPSSSYKTISSIVITGTTAAGASASKIVTVPSPSAISALNEEDKFTKKISSSSAVLSSKIGRITVAHCSPSGMKAKFA